MSDSTPPRSFFKTPKPRPRPESNSMADVFIRMLQTVEEQQDAEANNTSEERTISLAPRETFILILGIAAGLEVLPPMVFKAFAIRFQDDMNSLLTKIIELYEQGNGR